MALTSALVCSLKMIGFPCTTMVAVQLFSTDVSTTPTNVPSSSAGSSVMPATDLEKHWAL